jgi:hypothetical protein
MGTYFAIIGWQPTISDPSFMGWFTVFAYFMTVIVSAKVYVAGDYTCVDRPYPKGKIRAYPLNN